MVKALFDKYSKVMIILAIVGMTILFGGYVYSSGLQGDDSYYVINGITSIVDLFKKTFDYTIAYYQGWNGRFLVNFVNVLIVNCGMIVQTFFVILIIASVLLSFFYCIRPRLSIFGYVSVTLFILLMGSDDFLFNTSCLNIVCNYLFPIPFYLIMVKVIIDDDMHYSLLSIIGLCGLALISGSLIETYSFALAIFVIVMVICKQFHLNAQKSLIGLCYAIGALILLLCPGSYSREAVLNDGLLGLVYRANGIVGCFSDWLIIPLLCFSITMVLTKTKLCDLTKLERGLLLYSLIQVLLMCVAPYFPPRALMMVNFILVSVSVRLWATTRQYAVINAIALVNALAICGQLMIAFGRIIFAG